MRDLFDHLEDRETVSKIKWYNIQHKYLNINNN